VFIFYPTHHLFAERGDPTYPLKQNPRGKKLVEKDSLFPLPKKEAANRRLFFPLAREGGGGKGKKRVVAVKKGGEPAKLAVRMILHAKEKKKEELSPF